MTSTRTHSCRGALARCFLCPVLVLLLGSGGAEKLDAGLALLAPLPAVGGTQLRGEERKAQEKKSTSSRAVYSLSGAMVLWNITGSFEAHSESGSAHAIFPCPRNEPRI